MKMTTLCAIKKLAISEYGQEEYDRRMAIADAHAKAIEADLTWFPQDPDRKDAIEFMHVRLRSLAAQLGAKAFKRFETKSHDVVGCAVLEMIESGILT